MTTRSMTATAAAVVVMQAMGAAQAPTPPAAPTAAPPAAVRPIDRTDLRRHIYTMEGALSRAVAFGAQRLNREVRSVMPEMIALSGEPQARGVYLDGYGVFFDVGVPVLHQSMFWSLRTMLGQDPRGLSDALNTLKQGAKELDGPRRTATENAIARLELQIGPIPDRADTGVHGRSAGDARSGRGALRRRDARAVRAGAKRPGGPAGAAVVAVAGQEVPAGSECAQPRVYGSRPAGDHRSDDRLQRADGDCAPTNTSPWRLATTCSATRWRRRIRTKRS